MIYTGRGLALNWLAFSVQWFDHSLACLSAWLSSMSSVCLCRCLSCLSVWLVSYLVYLSLVTICHSFCLSSCCFSPQLVCLRYLILDHGLSWQIGFFLFLSSLVFLKLQYASLDTKYKSTGIQGHTLTCVAHQIYFFLLKLSLAHHFRKRWHITHTVAKWCGRKKIRSICTVYSVQWTKYSEVSLAFCFGIFFQGHCWYAPPVLTQHAHCRL